jgi:hypothetical protein
LGVPPMEERGVPTVVSLPVENAQLGTMGALRILEVGFALIAIATAIVAFVLHKKIP